MFKGERVIVTGAGQGLGEGIAKRFVSQGAKIAIVDLNKAGADRVASEIQAAGGVAMAVRCDVSKRESVEEAVRAVEAKWEGVDILVNNAGYGKNGLFMETDPGEMDRIMGVNLWGTIWFCRAALPGMITRNHGKIVNLASDAARLGVAKEAVYAAAKGGVIAFSKSLSAEVARYKINVNVVSPSSSDTPMLRGLLNAEQIAKRERAIPMGRLGRPEDVAAAVAFLASPDAEYVTGQMLSINGGSARID